MIRGRGLWTITPRPGPPAIVLGRGHMLRRQTDRLSAEAKATQAQ